MEIEQAAEEADGEDMRRAAEPPEEDASQVPESPEVPIRATQETGAITRAEAKRKESDMEMSMLEGPREHKRLREDSEPVDEEDGGPKARRKERPSGPDAPVVSKRFQNVIGMLHSQISQHRYGNIFHNPIKKSEAPDYHDIVKRPMDLKTIKSRVKDGLITNSLEFQRDIYLMFANAMMYNRPGSEIYNMAEEMMLFSEREINAFRQTEGFHRM
ncbi:Bromodomain-containing protein [Trametes punicea]|nr:Bromodomain-containing protein [Trametes punicea]